MYKDDIVIERGADRNSEFHSLSLLVAYPYQPTPPLRLSIYAGCNSPINSDNNEFTDKYMYSPSILNIRPIKDAS